LVLDRDQDTIKVDSRRLPNKENVAPQDLVKCREEEAKRRAAMVAEQERRDAEELARLRKERLEAEERKRLQELQRKEEEAKEKQKAEEEARAQEALRIERETKEAEEAQRRLQERAANEQAERLAKEVADRELVDSFLAEKKFKGINAKKSSFLGLRSHYALHSAVRRNNAELVRALLASQADPLSKSSSSKTALDIAKSLQDRAEKKGLLEDYTEVLRALGGSATTS